MQADDRQVVAGAEQLGRGAQELGPDQHRVQPADEEEDADPDQVLHADHLVVGAEAEVAPDAALLVLPVRGLAAEHPRQRVPGEPEPDQEPDHEEQVAEHQRDVVLARVGEVLDALRVDLVAEPPAEVEAGDPEHDAGEDVEARSRGPPGDARRPPRFIRPSSRGAEVVRAVGVEVPRRRREQALLALDPGQELARR